MNYMNLLLAIFVPAYLGYLFVTTISGGGGAGRAFALAVSYGIGMGFLGQLMLGFSIFHVKYTFSGILFVLVGVLLFLFFLKSRLRGLAKGVSDHDPAGEYEKPNPRWLYFAVLIFVVFNVIWIVVMNFLVPICGWDPLATIAFKAKIIFYEGSLNAINQFPHKTYPLQIPFVLSWLAMAAGQWSDRMLPALVTVFYVLSMLSSLYLFLRRFRYTCLWSLLAVAMLLSSNIFLSHAVSFYVDLPLSYYNLLTFLFLFIWNDSRHCGWLVLSALASGMGAFVKLEGIIYTLIHVFALCALLFFQGKSRESRKALIRIMISYALIPALMIASFGLYKKFHIISNENLTGFHFHSIHIEFTVQKLWGMLLMFFQSTFISGNWIILWIIFLLGVLRFFLFPAQNLLETKVVFVSVLAFLSLVILGLASTPFYFDVISSGDPLTRVMLHFFPMVVLFIVFVFGDRVNENK